MAKNKGPGVEPLGHPPMSKVKLEGPRMKHDNHGSTDSQPMKGNGQAIPGEHWEMSYQPNGSMGSNPPGYFNPKRPSERFNTHNMVNECDH